MAFGNKIPDFVFQPLLYEIVHQLNIVVSILQGMILYR
ncbi:MAG: hypothetical protein IPO64_12715 [Bacteroidetes bacterium]|nr:hypothetical protein [Bacteroidota bacterium]